MYLRKYDCSARLFPVYYAQYLQSLFVNLYFYHLVLHYDLTSSYDLLVTLVLNLTELNYSGISFGTPLSHCNLASIFDITLMCLNSKRQVRLQSFITLWIINRSCVLKHHTGVSIWSRSFKTCHMKTY